MTYWWLWYLPAARTANCMSLDFLAVNSSTTLFSSFVSQSKHSTHTCTMVTNLIGCNHFCLFCTEVPLDVNLLLRLWSLILKNVESSAESTSARRLIWRTITSGTALFTENIVSKASVCLLCIKGKWKVTGIIIKVSRAQLSVQFSHTQDRHSFACLNKAFPKVWCCQDVNPHHMTLYTWVVLNMYHTLMETTVPALTRLIILATCVLTTFESTDWYVRG